MRVSWQKGNTIEEVGGEAVAQCVAADRLRDSCCDRRRPNRLLDDALVDVELQHPAAIRVLPEPGIREDELPTRLARNDLVLALEGGPDPGLAAAADSRNPLAPLGARELPDRPDGPLEHVGEKEDQGIERLALRPGRNAALDGKELEVLTQLLGRDEVGRGRPEKTSSRCAQWR